MPGSVPYRGLYYHENGWLICGQCRSETELMSIPSLSLEGKVAIVTGGRRGIGEAIALAFAEAGADLVICDRVIKGGELQAVAEEIQRLGQRSLAIQADIAHKVDVDNLVQKVMDEFTDIDILVNNAGIVIRAPFMMINSLRINTHD